MPGRTWPHGLEENVSASSVEWIPEGLSGSGTAASERVVWGPEPGVNDQTVNICIRKSGEDNRSKTSAGQ